MGKEKEKTSSGGRSLGFYLVFVVTVYAIQLATFPKYTYNRISVKYIENKLLELDVLPRRHAVVIDAGSTGSRVLAFSFYTSILNGELVLFDELWHEEKPGLSSYADQPKKAAESINRLIALAKGRIPEQYWPSTPISLKATAGLRLLPTTQSDAIIDAVKSSLKSSGFIQLAGDPGVEIMSDLEEGLCGWMTVNFLLDLVNHPEKSAAALDLGGGSTQISFLPTSASTIMESPESYIVNKNIGGQDTKMYSHSYLGLGLMAARKSIIKESERKKIGDKEISTSPCFTKDVVWSQKDGEYRISGHKSGFDECHAKISTFINTKGVHSPAELASRTLVAFSYFYDRAVDSGLLPEEGGSIKIGQYKEMAKKKCSMGETSDFLCFDLTFIYSLLRSYGLSDSGDLQVYKKIDGHETSWALGLALQLLA
eukprot:TRINITY_DN15819_c0_g1_i3.p1 TRINITY_DN15819_c0_g1~~TRINITY_DN15819_c0_g1_i3.p1  ORF type:complete len:426 (-),score=53.73 TRINITY_DN15819_c0_g1_i3:391-1668(-)